MRDTAEMVDEQEEQSIDQLRAASGYARRNVQKII